MGNKRHRVFSNGLSERISLLDSMVPTGYYPVCTQCPKSVLYQSYISPISVLHQSYISPISVIYQFYINHISVLRKNNNCLRSWFVWSHFKSNLVWSNKMQCSNLKYPSSEGDPEPILCGSFQGWINLVSLKVKSSFQWHLDRRVV